MLVMAILLLLITLLLGMPVPFAFFISSIWILIVGGYSYNFLFTHGYNSIGSIVLLAIPLFIMAGGIMQRGNIAESLINGAVAVVSCAVFGSITGSSSATLSCIGAVMFPRLKKNGYPLGHTAALLASASVLGMLIPPSTLMILYSWIGGQSVLACFLAGVIPGVILTFLMSFYNIYILRNSNIMVSKKINFGTFKKILVRRSINSFPALPFQLFMRSLLGFGCTRV